MYPLIGRGRIRVFRCFLLVLWQNGTQRATSSRWTWLNKLFYYVNKRYAFNLMSILDCTYIHMYTYIYTPLYVYIYAYTHTHTHTHTHIYIYIYILVCIYFFFIIQRVKARAIPCPHQPPSRCDNTVSVA